MKLYEIRVGMFYKNTPTQINDFPDILVLADSKEIAEQKAYKYETETGKVFKILWCKESSQILIK